MQCRYCGDYENTVVKTYLNIRLNTRVRTRICTSCGAKIRTDERINLQQTRRMNKKREDQLRRGGGSK